MKKQQTLHHKRKDAFENDDKDNEQDSPSCERQWSSFQLKLDTLERIRSDLSAEGFQVPGIVVCGAQSAGKSSLLESITQIGFPRAQNTCTRCPAVVQLQRVAGVKPHAFVGTDPSFDGAEMVEVDRIGDKIEELTNKLAGDGTIISSKPIHIKVLRPDGPPSLTLIDLPGITHVCTSGKQNDIHDVTVGLVKEHIQNPNMVMLVAIPATDDFANAEALKLAREVDEDGARTLGVVTKADVVQNDSDFLHKMRMDRKHDVKLELGFIAVRNRTPGELAAEPPISHVDVLANEQKLFSGHPLLQQLDSKQWGIETLVRRIVELQMERVSAFTPGLRDKIKEKIKEIEKQLNKLPPRRACDTPSERRESFSSITSTLAHDTRDLMTGQSLTDDPNLRISLRITQFAEQCKLDIKKRIRPSMFLSVGYEKEVRESSAQLRGATLPNFMSFPLFRKLVLTPLQTAIPPAVRAFVNKARDLMEEVIATLAAQQCQELSDLQSEICDECSAQLADNAKRAMELVSELVEAQEWIHTMDHYYMCTVNKLKKQIVPIAEESEDTLTYADGFKTPPPKQTTTQHHNTPVPRQPIQRTEVNNSEEEEEEEEEGEQQEGEEEQEQEEEEEDAEDGGEGHEDEVDHEEEEGEQQQQQLQQQPKSQQQQQKREGVAPGAKASARNGSSRQSNKGGKKRKSGDATNAFVRRVRAQFSRASNEKQAVWDMQISLYAYSKLVLKQVFDIVAKLVRSQMVAKVQIFMEQRLPAAFSDERLASVMCEDRHIKANRTKLQKRLDRLRRSDNELRHINLK